MDFDGKVAIVTGGSTGLGETIAEELFKRGARVVIAARHEEQARVVSDGLDPTGKRVYVCKTDVRDPRSVKNLIDTTLERALSRNQVKFVCNYSATQSNLFFPSDTS